MTNNQRMRSDLATMDRREVADKVLREHRVRNDELTMERRSKADETMETNRSKNDETTAERRDLKDGNVDMVVAASLLVLIVLGVSIFLIVI